MSRLSSLIKSVPDPAGENYIEHARSVRHFNAELRGAVGATIEDLSFPTRVASMIESVGGDPRTVLLTPACVGSDGREEKGVDSPVEFRVYIGGTPIDPSQHSVLANRLSSIISQSQDAQRPTFSPNVEVKPLAGIASTYGQSKDLWPCRVLDSRPLGDYDGDVLMIARGQIAYEVHEQDGARGLGKKLIEKIANRFREYRKIVESGVQQTRLGRVVHFDLDEGTANFDRNRSEVGLVPGSFKHNVLRMVQNGLNRLALQHVRTLLLENGVGFLRSLPANTSDKIEFLKSEGVFNRGIAHKVLDGLIDNYLYFLWLYHQSEYSFRNRGQTVITFDPKETKARRDDLVNATEASFVQRGG